jgi:hypothetical protein
VLLLVAADARAQSAGTSGAPAKQAAAPPASANTRAATPQNTPAPPKPQPKPERKPEAHAQKPPTPKHPTVQAGDDPVIRDLELLMIMEMMKDYDLLDDTD